MSRRIVNAAARLAEAARLVAPGFGHHELTDVDLRALLAQARLTLSDVPIEQPFFVQPDPGAGGTLYLCEEAAAAPALHRFLVLRAVARFWPADEPRDRLEADAFALAGVLHRDGWNEGLGWVAERIAEIDSRDDAWVVAYSETLLPLAQMVVARVAPKRAAPEERARLAAEAAEAYEEGRKARRENDYERAVERFTTAARLAGRAEEWECRVSAIGSLGVTYRLRGNYPFAKRTLMRALREVRRHEVRSMEGIIYHELFRLAVEIHDEANALRLAQAAHLAYGPGHSKQWKLTHDVAAHWTVTGDFSRALPVLDALLSSATDHVDRLVVSANVARAAGGAAMLQRFTAAADQVRTLLDVPGAAEFSPACLLAIAYGARSLRLWTTAEENATLAWRRASEQRQARIRLEAEAVLDSLRPGAYTRDERIGGAQVEGRRNALAAVLLAALAGPA